jgi:hypothetical protein
VLGGVGANRASHRTMHSQLPSQFIGPGSSASEACPAPTTIGCAQADSETTLAWLFPCIASARDRQMVGASHHRWHCVHHTAPPVKIYLSPQYLLAVPRTRHSRSRYCPIYGVSCIDGSLTRRRTSGYFPCPLGSRTQERPTAGRPPIHVGRNATHSRPLVLADQGVLSSPSRLRRPMRFACQR